MQIVAAPSSFQFREGPHPPPGVPSRLHGAGRVLALDQTRLSRGACSAGRPLPRPGRPPPSPSPSAHWEPSPAPGASPEPRPRREPGAPPSRSAPPPENARSPAHPAGKRRLGAAAHASSCRRCLAGAAPDRHERVRGPVTASGMDCGSVTNERPKRRRRLLLSLVAGRGGGPGGRGVPPRHLLPGLLGGLGALHPRAPAARGGASRASPLLLLLLLPSPRLAAASPRRPLADWERSRAGPSATPAGRGCARRCQPGLAPGVTCAAGALHLCLGQVAALASSRRGEGRAAGVGRVSRGRRAPPGVGMKVCPVPPSGPRKPGLPRVKRPELFGMRAPGVWRKA